MAAYNCIPSFFPFLQGTTSITGFNSLRYVSSLFILGNQNLETIDGFSGVRKADSVSISRNSLLCYIGSELASEDYWKVNKVSTPHFLIFNTIFPALQNVVNATVVDVTLADSCAPRTCTDVPPPCFNGATCSETTSSDSGVVCACADSFFGHSCQFFNSC